MSKRNKPNKPVQPPAANGGKTRKNVWKNLGAWGILGALGVVVAAIIASVSSQSERKEDQSLKATAGFNELAGRLSGAATHFKDAEYQFGKNDVMAFKLIHMAENGILNGVFEDPKNSGDTDLDGKLVAMQRAGVLTPAAYDKAKDVVHKIQACAPHRYTTAKEAFDEVMPHVKTLESIFLPATDSPRE